MGGRGGGGKYPGNFILHASFKLNSLWNSTAIEILRGRVQKCWKYAELHETCQTF